MAIKRKCVCCGKEYEFCPNCMKKADPAWMTTFDSEVCKDLFNIVSAYNMKKVGKVRVQAFLAEHNITDFNKFTEPIKKVLEEVRPIVKNKPVVIAIESPRPEVIRVGQEVGAIPVAKEETIKKETKPTSIEGIPRDENVVKIVNEVKTAFDEISPVEKAEEIVPQSEPRPRSSRRRRRRSGY